MKEKKEKKENDGGRRGMMQRRRRSWTCGTECPEGYTASYPSHDGRGLRIRWQADRKIRHVPM